MRYRLLFILPVAALIILLTVYATTKENKGSNETGYITAVRLIGHKLLLSAGDTRSRVLPIKELTGRKYEIHFENPVSLEPDSIFNIIRNSTKSSLLPDEYSVGIIQCLDKEVAYSFINSRIDSNTIVPCLGRTLPKKCYYVSIDFAPRATIGSKPGYTLAAGSVIVLLSSLVFYLFRRRKQNRVEGLVDNTPSTINVLHIGDYLFSYDQRYLEINNERTELTDKESKLLYLLATALNTTIDREKFQKEVWENEGVIVTRSLDVFISRLRKKLEKDSSLRLINVHGKGYKLEVTARA